MLRYLLLLLALCLLPAGELAAGTGLGDAGHYLNNKQKVLLNNPSGKAFTITLFRFQWWIGGGWNKAVITARVTGPDGKVVYDGEVKVVDDGTTIKLAKGKPGVYTAVLSSGGTLNYWYATTSLDQAVVWTGPGTGDAIKSHWFLANPIVPRKWYFFVPGDCKTFTLTSQNNSGRSQREDHGLTVYSPRGQRLKVLWGQADPDAPEKEFAPRVRRRYQQAKVLVEPGSAGRFWSVEIGLGDSHTYSDVNLSLDGVPPYLAPTPEAWFDPQTGKPAAVVVYDETEFVQSDRTAAGKAADPLLRHWTPCPSFGDPDANEIRPPARVALWNPAGRQLRFVIGTYLPRNMFPVRAAVPQGKRQHLPEQEHDKARVVITGADGTEVLDTRAPLLHLHGGERWVRNIKTGKGVAYVNITEAEHFWMYTYPATPLAWIGEPTGDGWSAFYFDAGHGRNWYFMVPEGTKTFRVKAKAAASTDIMKLAINAPDRTMAMIYDNSGRKTVTVPPGMDGKIWHVRVNWGSASRPFGKLPKPRFPSMNMTLELKGVPGILSPTWEQWFDPEKPVVPAKR